MRFSYNWLQSFFDKKLPEPGKLAELLTMRSFEVENVVKTNADWVLDIDILPNRASDCLSHYGVVREIAVLIKGEILNPKSETNSKSKIQNKKFLQVSISNKTLCPRYASYVIDNIKITDSPDWIKERLASVGQKAINNIVDITNYVMWELGQPLHAFDFDKINGGKITIRTSAAGENLKTLDGASYDLRDNTIIIEDSERIIDLAGIKGGENTQIDKNTRRIIFQAAIFDSAHIRGTSQKLNIRTDASVRYMHGFDPELPPYALTRAFELLQETNTEAKIVQKVNVYPDPVKPKKIKLDVNYANRLLGANLSNNEVEDILKRLGFECQWLAVNGQLSVTVPTYRLDINIPEDLIEEIGRIYGYENIKPEPPRGMIIAPRRSEQTFWRSFAKQSLAGMGFSEVYNYSLISTSPPAPLLGKERGERGEAENGYSCLIELVNPVSDEFRYLRPSLWPGILKNIFANEKKFSSIKIFEIGRVFLKSKDAISENANCALAVLDAKNGAGGEGFYEIKGYIDAFFNKLGITDFYYDPIFNMEDAGRFSFLHNGRRANIMVNGKKCGVIGEVHPNTREAFGINNRVYISEINFDFAQNVANEERIYQKPSKYPEVVRDIAVLVPRDIMAVEVLNAINSVSGPMLRDIDLFDMFEGENLPAGMKNLAFHLLFQSDERTLTAHEVDEIMLKITTALTERLWEVR